MENRSGRTCMMIAAVCFGVASTVFVAKVLSLPKTANSETSKVCSVTAYTAYSLNGESFTYRSYQRQWSRSPPDKSFKSINVTGIWLFFQEPFYNFREGGMVQWIFGRNYQQNWHSEFANQCSSLKFVGNRNSWNEESLTLYSGYNFQGLEAYNDNDVADLFNAGFYKSMIIVGESPWTFYSEENYTGSAVCAYPTHEKEVSLDIGFYQKCDECLNIYSVRKGCYSNDTLRPDITAVTDRDTGGGSGFYDPNGAWFEDEDTPLIYL